MDMGRGEERVICMERVTWKLKLPYVNIWKFMVHVLLKPGLENFEHYIAGM